VEAVKAGEFYIFTHPFMRDFVEMRFQAIRGAFEAAGQSPVLRKVKEWAPLRANMPPAPK
jgi:hypothetical protein